MRGRVGRNTTQTGTKMARAEKEAKGVPGLESRDHRAEVCKECGRVARGRAARGDRVGRSRGTRGPVLEAR